MLWQLILLFLMALAIQISSCHHISSDFYSNSLYNPFSYGYQLEDKFGNRQWRHEESLEPNVVKGSYGFTDANGLNRQVEYWADRDGFHAKIRSNEPTLANSNSNSADVKIEAFPTKQASSSYDSPIYYNMQRS